jgi:hypothetical protein
MIVVYTSSTEDDTWRQAFIPTLTVINDVILCWLYGATLTESCGAEVGNPAFYSEISTRKNAIVIEDSRGFPQTF